MVVFYEQVKGERRFPQGYQHQTKVSMLQSKHIRDRYKHVITNMQHSKVMFNKDGTA